jgi:hypothetical protein
VGVRFRASERRSALDVLRETVSEHRQLVSETSTIPKGVEAVTLEHTYGSVNDWRKQSKISSAAEARDRKVVVSH